MGLFDLAPALAGFLARFPRALGSMFGAVAPASTRVTPSSACSCRSSVCSSHPLSLPSPNFLSVGFHRRLFPLSHLGILCGSFCLSFFSNLIAPLLLSVGFPERNCEGVQ